MSIASAFRSLAELAAKKAPYDNALALAQRRAALPVSEGGLGLPAGNTAMERAKAMGAQAHLMRPGMYNGPRLSLTDNPEEGLFYRFGGLPDGGTSRHVQHGFDETGVSTMGPLESLGSSSGITPAMAMSYAIGGDGSLGMGARPLYVVKGKKLGERGSDGEPLISNAAIVREATPHERAQLYSDIDKVAGLPDVRKEFNAEIPNYSALYQSLPNGQLRSRFAAFDPFRRGESDLLAGLAPYAAPAAAMGLAGAAMAPGEAEAGIAGPLAKTADLAALKIAQKAEAGGLPMAKIYDATGWAKGVDGKWRWEFDDSGVRIKDSYKDQALPGLYDVISAPNAARAYPELEDTGALLDIAPGLSQDGFYNPNRNLISMKSGHEKEAASGLLHETQHAIQEREGFARGGNPAAVGYDDSETARLAAQLRATQQRYMQAKNTGQDPYGIESSPDAVKNELDRAKQEWESHKKTMQAMREGGPQEAYRRLAGEVEARNVQTRMGMTPDDRRMRPFWQTEDVPRADQIVQGQSGTSPYAEMQSLKRAASNQARTHAAPRVPGVAERAGRSVLQEIANPINWLGLRMAALAYPREMGDPQALNYSDPYYSYSGSRR